MGMISVGQPRRSGRAWLPLVVLVPATAAAWIFTIHWARQMGNGPGPMGLDLGRFLGVWAVMMAAMMLPSLSALRTSAGQMTAQLAATAIFAVGYLALWAVVGSIAFPASVGLSSLVKHHHETATAAAVALFVICGLYQTSTMKWRLLRSCAFPTVPVRPLGETLVGGLGCGARCLAVSWSVMALLLAVGFMQVAGMALIAVALLIERRFVRRWVSVVLGVAAVGYGVAVAVHPALAPGLVMGPMGGM